MGPLLSLKRKTLTKPNRTLGEDVARWVLRAPVPKAASRAGITSLLLSRHAVEDQGRDRSTMSPRREVPTVYWQAIVAHNLVVLQQGEDVAFVRQYGCRSDRAGTRGVRARGTTRHFLHSSPSYGRPVVQSYRSPTCFYLGGTQHSRHFRRFVGGAGSEALGFVA